MSLINEALKKAQKQRTGEAPPLASMPTIGGEPASQIAARSKPGGSNALILKIGAVAATLLVVIAGVIVMARLFSNPAESKTAVPTVVTAQAQPATLPAATIGAVAPPTVKASPAPEVATVAPTTFVLPVAVPPTPAPPVVVAAKVEPKPVVAAPVETPAPVATAKPAGALKLDSRSINYIEGLRVAGIRASGADSKVLMSDRVYRIGDIVEHDLDLKLVGITANSLTFENDSGARYTRNF